MYLASQLPLLLDWRNCYPVASWSVNTTWLGKCASALAILIGHVLVIILLAFLNWVAFIKFSIATQGNSLGFYYSKISSYTVLWTAYIRLLIYLTYHRLLVFCSFLEKSYKQQESVKQHSLFQQLWKRQMNQNNVITTKLHIDNKQNQWLTTISILYSES